MKTFAEKVIRFNRNLDFTSALPENIRILNPFKNNPEINYISACFYRKFYGDHKNRKMIVGINPGRLGAGATGYDSMYDFMIAGLRTQINFGIDRTTGYVLGKKNLRFFSKINEKEHFFEKLVQLEHPRYIVQYKSKETDKYIAKYLDLLR